MILETFYPYTITWTQNYRSDYKATSNPTLNQNPNTKGCTKFLGTINWVRPYLGLTKSQLAPLFDLSKGDPELTSPRKLTPEAKAGLEIVEQAITNRQVHQICPEVCITVFILIVNFHPTGTIGQWNTHWPDPLPILECIFLPHQPRKTAPTVFELIAQLIIKCCHRCLQLNARDPSQIIIPVTQEQFEWCFANCTALQTALQKFSGQIACHLPNHRLLKWGNCTISKTSK